MVVQRGPVLYGTGPLCFCVQKVLENLQEVKMGKVISLPDRERRISGVMTMAELSANRRNYLIFDLTFHGLNG
jgi:hypothetical protein